MTLASPSSLPSQHHIKAIRFWLACVAALVFLMVIVGGATRLTDSGLSITEWRPITGIIPPFSHEAWIAEFEKYRLSPQYHLLNKGMSLGAFQFIYWWEWGHRFLGRLIGFAYLLPLAYFIAKGWVRGRLMVVLLGMGLLGGLQGMVGWIMVASGLKPGMTAVAPIKLTLHLTLACLIFTSLVWMWSRLGHQDDKSALPARLRSSAKVLLGLILFQIALGGLVAGLDAGFAFNTWPLMDGRIVPETHTLLPLEPWWRNGFESIALVQFNHRLGAYALLAFALWHAVDAWRAMPGSEIARRSAILAILITTQACIGILTLLLTVPLWAGLLHQGFAIVVLAFAAIHAQGVGAAQTITQRKIAPVLVAST